MEEGDNDVIFLETFVFDVFVLSRVHSRCKNLGLQHASKALLQNVSLKSNNTQSPRHNLEQGFPNSILLYF